MKFHMNCLSSTKYKKTLRGWDLVLVLAVANVLCGKNAWGLQGKDVGFSSASKPDKWL